MPDERGHFDFLRGDADAIDGRRAPAAHAVGYRSRRRNNRALFRVLDVVNRVLVVVAAQHKVDAHLGKSAEYLFCALQAVSLGQLAFYRIVVHHDHARIGLLASLERVFGDVELLGAKVPNDRDIAHVQRDRFE